MCVLFVAASPFTDFEIFFDSFPFPREGSIADGFYTVPTSLGTHISV